MRRLVWLGSVLGALTLAACTFEESGGAPGADEPGGYADCVSDTVDFCAQRDLGADACNELISELCAEGPADPGEPDPDEPGPNEPEPEQPDPTDACVEEAQARCEEFGGTPEQCAGLAAQYCESTGGGGGGEPDPEPVDTCLEDAQARCEEFGGTPEQCAGLAAQYCESTGGGGGDEPPPDDGGGLPGGGGLPDGDPQCLITTIGACVQAGGDIQACLALADTLCP